MAKRKYKYKIGQKFGEWTFLDYADCRGTSQFWKMQCSCGIVQEVFAGNVTKGKSTRCNNCLLASRKSRLEDDMRFGYPLSQYHLVLNTIKVGSLDSSVAHAICAKMFSLGLGGDNGIERIDPANPWAVDNFLVPIDSSLNRISDTGGVSLMNNNGNPVYTASASFGGKRKRKSFSISKYGEEKAKELATAQRKEWEALILEERRQYAKEHGII